MDYTQLGSTHQQDDEAIRVILPDAILRNIPLDGAHMFTDEVRLTLSSGELLRGVIHIDVTSKTCFIRDVSPVPLDLGRTVTNSDIKPSVIDQVNIEKQGEGKDNVHSFISNMWGSLKERPGDLESSTGEFFDNDIYQKKPDEKQATICDCSVDDTSKTNASMESNDKSGKQIAQAFTKKFSLNDKSHGDDIGDKDNATDERKDMTDKTPPKANKIPENKDVVSYIEGRKWSLQEIMEKYDQKYPDEDNEEQLLGNTVQEDSQNTRAMYDAMKDFASSNGFQMKDCTPNGNCMFLAIHDQLRINGDFRFNARSLRQKAVEYLKANPVNEDGTHLECFLTGKESWEEYLGRIFRNKEWGDHLVISALTNVLGRKIVVFNINSSEDFIHHELAPKMQDVTRDETLYLGHLGEFHYLSLRPNTWRETWVAKAKRNLVTDLCPEDKKFIESNEEDVPISLIINATAEDKLTKLPFQHLSFLLKNMLEEDDVFELNIPSDLYSSSESYKIVTAGGRSDGTEVFLKHNNPSKHLTEYLRRFRSELPLMIMCMKERCVVCDGISEEMSTAGIDADINNTHPGYCHLHLHGRNPLRYLKGWQVVSDEKQNTLTAQRSYCGYQCKTWPMCAKEWLTRETSSGWPGQRLKEQIKLSECFVINRPHPRSTEPHIEWQFIFPMAEEILMKSGISRMQRYLYDVFKIIVDYQQNHLTCKLHTVHIKAIFFYACDEIKEDMFDLSPGGCFLHMVQKLIECLRNGNLPHYFIKDNNIIDHIPKAGIVKLLEAIEGIRLFPVQCLDFLTNERGYKKSWMVDIVQGDIGLFRQDKDLNRMICSIFFPTMIRQAKRFAIDKQYYRAYLKVRQSREELVMATPDKEGSVVYVPNLSQLLRESFECLDEYTKCMLAQTIAERANMKIFDESFSSKKVKDFTGGIDIGGYGENAIPFSYVGNVYMEAWHLNSLGMRLHQDNANYNDAAVYYEAAIDHLESTMEDTNTKDEATSRKNNTEEQPTKDKNHLALTNDGLEYICFTNLVRVLTLSGRTDKIRRKLPQLVALCKRMNSPGIIDLIMEVWEMMGEPDKGEQLYNFLSKGK